MSDYLVRLLTFYWNPRRAVSETLDHAKLAPAIVLAVILAVALQAPGYLQQRKLEADLASAEAVLEARPQSPLDPEVRKAARRMAEAYHHMEQARNAPGGLREIALLAGLFVPAAIGLVTFWLGRGRCSATIAREYGSVLLCIAASWTAARLPLVPVNWLRFVNSGFAPEWTTHVSTALFLVFAAISLRVCLGSEWLPAGAGAALGGGVVVFGGLVSGALAPFLYLLASPCLLLLLWYYFGGAVGAGVSAVGSSISARQSFQHALEATTLNPRDADAHYQLGLIQHQRHNLAEAETRFRTAAQIDPTDADYAYHLGRVLAERGQPAQALECFEKAAQLNPKVSSGEVWREIGGTQLGLGNWQESLPPLERYVERREYDPVGLVYYGEALEKAGRPREARDHLARAVEAYATMPSHRRGELRAWASRAKAGLRRLNGK